MIEYFFSANFLSEHWYSICLTILLIIIVSRLIHRTKEVRIESKALNKKTEKKFQEFAKENHYPQLKPWFRRMDFALKKNIRGVVLNSRGKLRYVFAPVV